MSQLVAEIVHVKIHKHEEGQYHFTIYLEDCEGESLGAYDVNQETLEIHFPDHIFDNNKETFFLLYEKFVQVDIAKEKIFCFLANQLSEEKH